MGFEYTAQIATRLDAKTVVRFFDGLVTSGALEELARTSDELRLRFVAVPARDKWPQDAEVAVGPFAILLTVHAGDAQARALLLEEATRALAEIGVTATFVEL